MNKVINENRNSKPCITCRRFVCAFVLKLKLRPGFKYECEFKTEIERNQENKNKTKKRIKSCMGWNPSTRPVPFPASLAASPRALLIASPTSHPTH
jgi:hypothetical protein